jgi:hypothetical protein
MILKVNEQAQQPAHPAVPRGVFTQPSPRFWKGSHGPVQWAIGFEDGKGEHLQRVPHSSTTGITVNHLIHNLYQPFRTFLW